MSSHEALSIGQNIRQYRIERKLGEGGFGITYLAHDEDLKRNVAIKECFPGDFVKRKGTSVIPTAAKQQVNYEWALEKFVAEATTLAKFNHPGIVQVLQIIKDENNTAYMVLELVEGMSFAEWLNSLKRTPTQPELQDIVAPLLDALDAVHKSNYSHRDVAPDNIIIRNSGSAVLLDFGAAKLSVGGRTKTLNLVVKDGYSPPELYYMEGKSGPWTDIYALGATLYKAITGQTPIDAAARLNDLNNDDPDPLPSLVSLQPAGFSQEFLQAIDQALSTKQKERPASIEEWKQQLLAGAMSQADQPPQIAPRGQTRKLEAASDRQQSSPGLKKALAALAACAVAAAGYAALIWWPAHQEEQKRIQILAEWRKASSVDQRKVYEAFLDQYPDSAFAADARRAMLSLDTSWNRTFGGPGRDSGLAIAAVPEGEDTIVAGQTYDTANNTSRPWLSRLSGSGKPVWTISDEEYPGGLYHGVVALEDGSVYVVGRTGRTAQGTDGLIKRFNADGQSIWSRTFGGDGNDVLRAIATSSDGQLLVVGSVQQDNAHDENGWAMKLSRDGSVIWDRNFGGEWADQLTAVSPVKGSGMVTVGHTRKSESGSVDLWYLRLNSRGEAVLNRTGGGSGHDEFTSVVTLDDGSARLGGLTTSVGTKTTDALIVRLTATNKAPPKMWQESAEDRVSALVVHPNGSLLFAGFTQSKGKGSADGWLVGLSLDAKKKKWEKLFGGGKWDEFSAITVNRKGDLLLTGSTASSGQGESDIWVVKIGAEEIGPNT